MASSSGEKLKIPKKTIAAYVLGILVLVIGINHFVELEDIVELFQRVHPLWLLLAVFAQALTYVCVSNAVHVFFTGIVKKTLLSRWELFQTAIVMVFLNQAIPTVGVSGNAFFFSQLIKKGGTTAQSISFLILEMITHYLAYLLWLVAGFVLLFTVIPHTTVSLFVTIGILGLILYVFFITLILILGERKRDHPPLQPAREMEIAPFAQPRRF